MFILVVDLKLMMILYRNFLLLVDRDVMVRQQMNQGHQVNYSHHVDHAHLIGYFRMNL
jgi:hypothetical protein